jgi:hypothetical protein
MMRSRKKSKAESFNVGGIASIPKIRPYIQRVTQDSRVRDQGRIAVASTRSAYDRLTSGKSPAKALLNDKKLQGHLRDALEAARDATIALTVTPKKRTRSRVSFSLTLLGFGIAAGLALACSEKLRSKLLDPLFGGKDEAEYSPQASAVADSRATLASAP